MVIVRVQCRKLDNGIGDGAFGHEEKLAARRRQLEIEPRDRIHEALPLLAGRGSLEPRRELGFRLREALEAPLDLERRLALPRPADEILRPLPDRPLRRRGYFARAPYRLEVLHQVGPRLRELAEDTFDILARAH